ncbi:hypothetical protein D3C86_1209700 [compost metagenome]
MFKGDFIGKHHWIRGLIGWFIRVLSGCRHSTNRCAILREIKGEIKWFFIIQLWREIREAPLLAQKKRLIGADFWVNGVKFEVK